MVVEAFNIQVGMEFEVFNIYVYLLVEEKRLALKLFVGEGTV